MLLLIDNYDSFTFNLVQYLGEIGADVQVVRNDQVSLDEIERLGPDHLVVSPGPCTPAEAGLSNQIIGRFGPRIPTLGVCLGHQCIGAVFQGVVERARQVVHGKTSFIHHNGSELFHDVPNPFEATRYHSLVVREENLPDCLERTAWTEDGVIMGLRHREFPIWGVQFHPESILTRDGKTILSNFLAMKVAAERV
ncbi:aminodeoxychorismate/anthranilate synthase component II [bacterium]|nr:aminodeoxychorismate/anthranilate synthase component II [bacterium]